MAGIATAIVGMMMIAWGFYSIVRIAPYIEHRWTVWGEIGAFVFFFAGFLLLLILLSRM
jgi:hypothetical protein